MLKQFEDLRNEIRHYAAIENDYKKTVELCFEYLSEINKIKDVDVLADKTFIYYEIALNSKKLGDFSTAVKYGLITLNLLKTSDFGSKKYINRMWLIGVCYENLGNISEAKRLYYECSRLLKRINEDNQRAMIIFNNAKLMKNFKTMRNVIKIYETRTLKSTTLTHGDMEYDDVLKEMYSDLYNLYIVENRQEAFSLLYMIKNKKFRKELSAKLVA